MQYLEISSDFSAAHFLESEFIHGHNFKIKVKFLDGEGIDPDKAKSALDEICAKFKNKVILSESSVNNANQIKLQEKTYKIAKEDIIFLPVKATTAEYVSEYIAKKLKEKFNIKIYVEIEEDYDSSATFSD